MSSETNQAVESTVEETKPKYNPAVNYKWNPEDTFTLSGQEFAFTFNVLASKEIELRQQLELIMMLREKLAKAVEEGVAIENIPENKEAPKEA